MIPREGRYNSVSQGSKKFTICHNYNILVLVQEDREVSRLVIPDQQSYHESLRP